MPDSRSFLKAALVAGAAIGLIVFGLFALAGVIAGLLGLPTRLDMPLALRMAGAALLLAGLGLALWLFKYRSPMDMIASTYHTFVKMFTRTPVYKIEGRTEPLVVKGPQKYVRNPLYLAATCIFLGWALLTGGTSSLVGVAFVLVWFRFVQIPFEERELRAIFGDEYSQYSKEVPMLIPSLQRRSR
ncbi:MAG TPA: isoprenylcysteine carboxylmethyltransferase family protein [Nitrososphaerales archaeon]|nr:isoprenylcysteine carboxylmethyltransferase family protein [Nitrososphaerales archaeon]